MSIASRGDIQMLVASFIYPLYIYYVHSDLDKSANSQWSGRYPSFVILLPLMSFFF